MSAKPEIARRLRQFFAEEAARQPVLLAYLFGSRAAGTEKRGSDFDFALLLGEGVPSDECYVLAHRLAEHLETDQVDLVVLNRAPIELRYNVVATGHLLYEANPAARAEFEAQTSGCYFEHLPVLRRERQALLDEGEEAYAAGVQRYRAAPGATERMPAPIGTSERQP